MTFESGLETETQPCLRIRHMTFNDGTALQLEPNGIVVFTGANNCGKSQALRDTTNWFNDRLRSRTVVLQQMEFDCVGTLNKAFFDKHFYVNESGYLEIHPSEESCDKEFLTECWNNKELHRPLLSLFVKRISTESRLTESNDLQRNDYSAFSHPIRKMADSECLSEGISDQFLRAFGEELVVNRNELNTISLHVGKAPNKDLYTIRNQDEYYGLVSHMPKLQDQGDGMRSFASILLDMFTSDHSITLIDEPEAFLHPPQAKILGELLAECNSDNHQLIISTHSEEFLKGLIDAGRENITVVRISRNGNINKMSILSSNEIKALWTNPLLRYSNILSGLFHEKVVVCESDYDCLFYQAVLNAIYENEGKIAPDILFTHTGGKSRIKDVARALKAVDVPVVAICDFDILDAGQDFRPLAEALGLDWSTVQTSGMKIVYDSMNAKQKRPHEAWKAIKRIGKAGFDGKEPAAYEKVEKLLKSHGLFVVPCGELECFDKTIDREKKDWVYEVLTTKDLATDPQLEGARQFVQEIANYRPTSAKES